jgi:RNA polymerase sigma-70 factor (ECF subfamily)
MEFREQTWAEAMRVGRRGDASTYERLLREIAKVLRGLIRCRLARLGLSVDEAEDVVQEVLLGLHMKRHVWDETRPLLPWLHAIVRYKLTDTVRRLRREARYRCDLTLEEWSSAFEAVAQDVDRGLVDIEYHVDRLPVGQREVVRALALEGASVQVTAKKLQTSEGAVRMTLHRALQRLVIAADVRRLKSTKGKV